MIPGRTPLRMILPEGLYGICNLLVSGVDRGNDWFAVLVYQNSYSAAACHVR